MTELDEAARRQTNRSGSAPKSPASPGASVSPQRPGMTPDRSGVPGHFSTRVTAPATKRRPLTQYGTAEEIMRVFKRQAEDQITPAHWEQATASFEELRKANPADLPPVRPARPALPAAEEPEALPESTPAS